ncbi:MAG TPA: dockerin type I domain-containing protein [Thermoanaerobaculaceae bacterium]|nr:dockerin type I domain-containing protein [Thermoanaerobaculaceae bacterium]
MGALLPATLMALTALLPSAFAAEVPNSLQPARPGISIGTPPQPPAVEAISVPSAGLGATAAAWLTRANQIRAMAGLPAVTETASWSSGDYNHARYCVKNDYIGHSEDPANLYYTSEGNLAAQNSNVMVSSDINTTDEFAINLWMAGPFHGVGIIDPALSQVGFGSYREAIGSFRMAAALDVLRGLGSIPPSVAFPVAWPGNGAIVDLTTFEGGESPDPLTGCPGYTVPTGQPISLQVGAGGTTPSVTAHSFSVGGTPLPHCVFDETTYTNPNATLQSLGRGVLNMRDAVILIPRDPLVPGDTYTASITSAGHTTTWSFTVMGGTPPPGDVNGDGGVNVNDVFYLINSLFAGGPAPVISGDVNGDGAVNVNDVFYLINFLFAGGPAPQ